jgi:membrane fusion protein, heavy metal efflux system
MTTPAKFVRAALFASLIVLLTSGASGCGGEAPAAASARPDAGFEDEHGAGEAGHDERAAGDDAGAIQLTPQQLQSAAIEIATAGPATIRERLSLYGVVAPNAERVRNITPRFPGVIRSVSKRLGDPVRLGEALAMVESDESLQTYTLSAPLAGVVTSRHANPGERAGDQVLFTVADLSTVWVEVALFPRDRGRIRVGQSARVRSDETGRATDGQIAYVAPFGSPSNQTIVARVLLDNRDGHWSPGLYVTVDVTLTERLAPVAVRNIAIQGLGDQTVVFAQHPDGFEPQPVQLGRSDDSMTEILGGLAAGDRYVAGNSFILKAEFGKGEAEHEH